MSGTKSNLTFTASCQFTYQLGFFFFFLLQIRTHLLCFKHKTRNIQHTTGSANQGDWTSSYDVDFFIEKDMLFVSDNSKVGRKYPEYFMRRLAKMAETL